MTTTDNRTRTAKVPGPRQATRSAQKPSKPAKPAPKPARIAHRYHLDTEIKELTPAMRAERGRQLRSTVPRSSHADFAAGPDRRDPIELLIGQSESREPDLVPIRYGRMLAS